MSGEKFEKSMETIISKMSYFMSSKTVVGDPIHIDNVIIVPLIDVTFGAGAGGFENQDDKTNKDSTGGGVGGKISPTAVIVVVDGTAQMIHVKQQESVNKLIDMVPGILSKLNLGNFGKKTPEKKDNEEPEIIFEKDLAAEIMNEINEESDSPLSTK